MDMPVIPPPSAGNRWSITLRKAIYHLPFTICHSMANRKWPMVNRPAYVFLISVLFIGAIAMSTAATLVVLGVGSMKTSIATTHSTQAMHNAETCVEQALRSLRTSVSYDGDETITLTNGTCELLAIGGSGKTDRVTFATGLAGKKTL